MIATLGFITSTPPSFGFKCKYKHKYLSKCKYICKTVKNELVAHCVESRVTSVAKNDEKISLQGFKDILILFIRRNVWLLSGM